MNRRLVWAALGGAFFTSVLPRVWGSDFGTHRVRADAFPWRVVPTAHFDIHVTPEGESLLPRVAEILEAAHARVTADLEVPVPGRTPVFLYPTHNQFEQTNIVDVDEGTGGVTEAFKNRLLFFHDGTDAWLRHVLPHEFTHVVEFEALYGGFWRSARLIKSPFYPLWFMEGLAEYESGDVDRVEEDMVLRDAATRGALFSLADLHGFGHLKPHQVTRAYKQGGAAVRYLAETYGRDTPGRFLKALRDRFEMDGIFQELTGLSAAGFDERYRRHLTALYAAQSRGLTEPTVDGRAVTAADPLPVFNTAPALSPDGRFLAYVSDRGGASVVRLRNRATGVERVVAGAPGERLDRVEGRGRALAFSPDGRWLAFVGEKQQRDFLFLYDVHRGHLRRVRTPLAELRSPVFHPDGTRLAVSGLVNGVRDLYEISTAGRVRRRLTATPEAEDQPAYAPDGHTLVFSREVPGGVGDRPESALVRLDLGSGRTTVLTALPGRETEPVFGPDGKAIFFVGEGASSVRDLYRWDAGGVARLTRAIGGHATPAFSADGRVSVFGSFRDGSFQVYEARPGLWTGGDPVPVVGEPPAPPAPLATAAPRPYRFRASTDLFFPVVYYSSEGGLFAASYWQASDLLANHGVSVAFQYGGADRALDYRTEYVYRRFRPDFFLRASGESFYNDVDRKNREWESRRGAGVIYPWDRFHRLEGEVSFLRRDETFQDAPARNTRRRENTLETAWVRDTAHGRYLAVTAGSRLRLSHRWTPGALRGERHYQTEEADHQVFFPLGGESSFALRTRAGVSVGDSPELLRLGGADRLRGYARRGDDNRAPRYVLWNAEWRTPLAYWRGARVPLLSAVAFKGLYGKIFVDAGVDWKTRRDWRDTGWSDVKNAVGGGLGFPAFVFQTFPLWADVQVAKRTDARNWTVYLSLGPTF